MKATVGFGLLFAALAALLFFAAPGASSPGGWTVILIPFALSFTAFLVVAAGAAAAWRMGIPAWIRRRPRTAIALLSGCVVAVQCHPVLFSGRSFVAPNNPVLLLYENFPTLPGYQSDEIENSCGSDVGALMWWHLDRPVIARRALFRDGELPLWDRYSMGGLPELGQGQSMFGDPLNFLTVFTNGAAWSWDARFVICRWLLCCGVGLAVLGLIADAPAALLSAAGAGFLGFFGFRLNHPANFSLAYSPWILVAWIALIRSGTVRQAARRCLGLIAANFCVMTSGTVKEAYILILVLNLAGLFLWLAEPGPWMRRCRILALAAGSAIVFVLVTAPWWRTFTAALKHAVTNYDRPDAVQVPPSLLLGFFDDLFSRQLQPGETIYMPAASFFILLGFAWAAAAPAAITDRRAFRALLAAALLPLGIVFGLVPADWLMRIPFIANIVHVGDVFTCPLIILAAVAAGFGFAALRRPVENWGGAFRVYLLLLAGLYFLYLGSTQAAPKSAFFTVYAWSLTLGLILVPLGLRWAARRFEPGLAAAVWVSALALFGWRHSQYVHTAFDDYVFNPQPRVRLDAPSPAVAFVNSRLSEPARPLGFSHNLFSGYSTILNWESILGVDPLRSPYFDGLANALGIARVTNANATTGEDDIAHFLRGLDLLNVRFFLARHRNPAAAFPGLRRLGQFDLDVYESPTAWPRAFFTDRIVPYRKAADLAALVASDDGRPIAAVQIGDTAVPDAVNRLGRTQAGRTVRPATHYRLTVNTTSFDIQAPSAGVVVLSENYFPHDFRLRVNGRAQDYFRVNHAFKGVWLEKAGSYHLTFEYWPRSLNFSLQLAAIGLLGLAAYVWAATLSRARLL